jgi:uncharacterized membrane protein
MNRVYVLERPLFTAPWSAVVLALALLAAIGFVGSFALPYLTLDQQALARYWPRRWWLLLHIAGGAVALLCGPVQLWLGVTGRTSAAHRTLGLAYVTGVGIGAVAAFYLAAHTDLGWVFGSGLTGLGVAWVLTTGLAVAAVRRGSIEQHQQWMIRSYVVTFAFVTFRALFGLLQAAGVGTLQERLAVSSWFCWAVPLLVTEAILQGRRIFGARRAGIAAAGLILLTGMPVPVDSPDESRRDTQGRQTDGLFEQALPPRQVQLALRVGF